VESRSVPGGTAREAVLVQMAQVREMLDG